MVIVFKVTHYHNLPHLVFDHSESLVIYSNFHLPNIRHSEAATIFISLSYGEGHQAAYIPTCLGQNIFAGALKVIVIAIEGVVVRITPRPAGGVVQGHAHGFALHSVTGLFLTT